MNIYFPYHFEFILVSIIYKQLKILDKMCEEEREKEREREHHHNHHHGGDALAAIAGGLAGAYAGSHLSSGHKKMGGALGAIGGAILGEKLAEHSHHKHHGQEYRDDGPSYNNPPPPMNNMGFAPQDNYRRENNNDYQYDRRGGPARNEYDNYQYSDGQQTYGRPPQGYPGEHQGRQGW